MSNFVKAHGGATPVAYLNSDFVWFYYIEENPLGFSGGWRVLAFVGVTDNWFVLDTPGAPYATASEAEDVLNNLVPGLQ